MKNQKFIFFTVAILTILTVVAVLLSNLFPDNFGTEYFRRLGLSIVLAEIIGLFVLIVKKSLGSKQISITLSYPNEILDQILMSISEKNHGMMIDVLLNEGFQEKIKLLRSNEDNTYKVCIYQKLERKMIGIEGMFENGKSIKLCS